MKRHKKSVIAAAMAMLLLSACSRGTHGSIEKVSNISVANEELHTESAAQSAENTSSKQTEQTDNPNLSVDVIPIGQVTSDLSIFENLSGSEEITFSLAE